MSSDKVNERAKQLLKMLIARYIREGQPVGSKALSESVRHALSPATIRNVLADLEASGYLTSPHTSAGRVPTARGFRLFVDGLLNIKPLGSSQVELLKQKLNRDADIPELMDSASTVLSNITRLAGVVTLNRQNTVKLRHVEFLPLSNNRVLVVLVLNEREVQNRIIHTERTYSASELQKAGNYLSHYFAGEELTSIHRTLLNNLHAEKIRVDRLMQTVVDIANKTFEQSEKMDDYTVSGEHNLFDLGDTDIDALRSIFSAFTEKQTILNLLQRCLHAEGIQIFIGDESGYEVFDEFSVVTSNYVVDGEVLGVLGVIGPKRMDYERVIPAVDITAKLLGAALSGEE